MTGKFASPLNLGSRARRERIFFHVLSKSDLDALAPYAAKAMRERRDAHIFASDSLVIGRELQMILGEEGKSIPFIRSRAKTEKRSFFARRGRLWLALENNLHPRISLLHGRRSVHVFGPTSLSIVEFVIAKLLRAKTVSLPHGVAFWKEDKFLSGGQTEFSRPNFRPRNRFHAYGVESKLQYDRMVRWGILPSKLKIVGFASCAANWIEQLERAYAQVSSVNLRAEGSLNRRQIVVFNWARSTYTISGSLSTQMETLALINSLKIPTLVAVHPTDSGMKQIREFVETLAYCEVVPDGVDNLAILDGCGLVLTASSTYAAHALGRSVPVGLMSFLDVERTSLRELMNVASFESIRELEAFLKRWHKSGTFLRHSQGEISIQRFALTEEALDRGWALIAGN